MFPINLTYIVDVVLQKRKSKLTVEINNEWNICIIISAQHKYSIGHCSCCRCCCNCCRGRCLITSVTVTWASSETVDLKKTDCISISWGCVILASHCRIILESSPRRGNSFDHSWKLLNIRLHRNDRHYKHRYNVQEQCYFCLCIDSSRCWYACLHTGKTDWHIRHSHLDSFYHKDNLKFCHNQGEIKIRIVYHRDTEHQYDSIHWCN